MSGHGTRVTERPPKVALLSPAVGTGNVGDHFIEMAIRRLLRDDVDYARFSIRTPLAEADVERINETDVALVCGTNLYQREWPCKLTREALEAITVPVVPFGVGSSAASTAERSVGATTRDMIRALHARCTLGSVRDPHTAEVVAGVGVENALLTGCPVLFWAQPGDPPEVRSRPRRRLVVTARNWLMHRWPDNVDHPVQIDFLRKVLDAFPPEDVVYAVHEDFDERLVERLGIPEEAVLRSDRPEDYVALYTDPDSVVLALRLHAGMLALANGVPALFVGHDTRTHSFCEMVGVPCVSLFAEGAAEESVERLRALRGGETADFAVFGERYADLLAAMKRFLAANDLPARGAQVLAR